MPWRPTDGRAALRRLLIAAGAGSVIAAAAGWLERSRRGMSRLRVLDQVGHIADGSLPLDETLDRVTQAVVPVFADVCMVDAIREGDVQRIAVRAVGPDAERIERSIRGRTPSTPDHLREPGSKSLEPMLVTEMTDEVLRGMANDEQDLEFLRWLDARSYIVAPLVSRGRSLDGGAAR
jgi:hypothetical protein